MASRSHCCEARSIFGCASRRANRPEAKARGAPLPGAPFVALQERASLNALFASGRGFPRIANCARITATCRIKVVAMLDRDGYRPNVAIVIANSKNLVFWGKRIREHAWQFPRGGIHPGETPEQAMFRELKEEVGLSAE